MQAWVDPETAVAVLKAGLRAGGSYADLYVERRTADTVRLAGGYVAELRSDTDVGAAVRVVAGETVGLAYTNLLTEPALLEAAGTAAAAARAAASSQQVTVDLTERPVATVQQARRQPADVPSGRKVDLLRRADEAARRQTGVRDVTAIHVDVDQDVLIANSEGTLARDRRVRTRLTCTVTARRNGRTETGFDGPGIGGGLELYDDEPPERIGERAAERALLALEGTDLPTGQMVVVLGPGGGGLLLHEACGHGLEADGLQRNSSVYAGTVNQQVASRVVTAVDDPSRSGAFGSYGVDDEGQASSPTLLIDEGTQVGAMTNLATARLTGAGRSANGRRASYADPPLPRMSNTYIEPGGDDPADVVADVPLGLYASRLRGGDVNIATGEFAFSAAEVFLIENGRLTRPLTGVTLLGNGPAALAGIEAVGSDLAFIEALCGKEDQWVPVSYGAPTLRISGLTVAAS